MSSEESVREVAVRARTASHELATATRATKDAALHAMADALLTSAPEVLAANAEDVARAESGELAAEVVPLSGDDGLLALASTLLGPEDSLEVPPDLPAVHADPVAVSQLFANLVGKENVMAGADCGFGGRSHPQIAWAKLESLVEGARLATERLYR